MSSQPTHKMPPLDVMLSEDDIYAAMEEIPGYIDITPGDFKELYTHACQHAINAIAGTITAGKIMNREVLSFNRKTPIEQVARVLAERNVSGAPVVDDSGSVAGVISAKDFISCIAGKGTRSYLSIILIFLQCAECVTQAIQGKLAEDIMSSPAITVTESASVIDIITLFNRHAINRVPVVDDTGRIRGIITRSDILKVPASLTR
jgi:CBS domain-containing membrane protein